MAPTKTATKSAAVKGKTAHPSFQDMIKECIAAHPEDSRAGVSRPTIKKYMADKYKLDMSAKANLNNLANAIKKGSETNVFSLPKGIGGRVKAVKKTPAHPAAGKENAPPSKTAVKPKAAATTAAKPVAKKPVAKSAAKPAAKAAPAKKAAPAAKKTTAAKKAPATKAAAKPKPAASKSRAKPTSRK